MLSFLETPKERKEQGRLRANGREVDRTERESQRQKTAMICAHVLGTTEGDGDSAVIPTEIQPAREKKDLSGGRKIHYFTGKHDCHVYITA